MENRFWSVLERGPLVFDGAMGTQLYDRGTYVNRCFDQLNVSDPSRVRTVHEDYVRAGAQVLETNTFGANRFKLKHYGLDGKVAEINQAGVQVARQVAGDRAMVAGAMGPTGLYPSVASPALWQEASEAFEEQARALCQAGVDAVIIETMRFPVEARIALDAVKRVAELPVIVQMSFDEGRLIADGTDPLTMARWLSEWGADVVGANCGQGPQAHLDVAAEMVKADRPVSIMPNAGYPRRHEGRFLYMATPEYLAEYARRLLKLGVRVIGGCCGTTPDHTAAIVSAVRMGRPRAVQVVAPEPRPVPAQEAEVLPLTERTSFGARFGSGFVVSVEVDPPETIDPAPLIERVQALAEAGIDIINVADGPRATARMSNIALSLAIRRDVDVEVILHVTARDRNLLGLMGDLLGVHALGLRDLVLITGDPPKLGDYPHATGVYDVDSVGLIRMVNGFNRGVDPAGRPMRQPTRFTIGCGAEPGSSDIAREVARFEDKVLAGADFVMTQPVYDGAALEQFMTVAERAGVPVLAGILPLASHRNAEFLHNEVPGMQIPDPIRKRMRLAGSGPRARREGIAIARETLAQIRHRVAGGYLMPAFGRLEAAVEVVDGLV